VDFQPQALGSASPGLQDHDGTRDAGDAEGASLLDGLKQEWRNTVQDFREKGAVGAVKDVAMDAASIVGSTASSALNGARSLVASNAGSSDAQPASSAGSSDVPAADENNTQEDPGLLGGLRQMGRNTVQEFREKGALGAVKDASLDAVDLVGSTAASALRGARSLVPVGQQAPDDMAEAADAGAEAADGEGRESQGEEGTLLDGLKQDLQDTVQEFREKGALGVFRDAALDAKDMVGSTAVSAYNAAKPALSNARSLAEPALSNARSFAEPAINGARSLAEPALVGARTFAEPAISRARTYVVGTTVAEEHAEPPSGSSRSEPAKAGSETKSVAQDATSESSPRDDGASLDMSDGSPRQGQPKRQSLVAMRRSAFEKPKEAEELID